jgi:hypothetical protein
MAIVVDANESEGRNAHPQPYYQCFKSTSGFHINGTINGSIKTFISNYGLNVFTYYDYHKVRESIAMGVQLICF